MLSYITISYYLDFDSPIKWRTTPETVFRSTIGYHLHKMCCVLKEENCETCPLNQTCAYSWFFESHIDKNSLVIPGSNRASHPFVLEFNYISSISGVLKVTFMGRSRNFIPYICEAIKRTSISGVAKERIPFIIKDISCNGVPFEYSMKETERICNKWPSEEIEEASGFLIFDTPCRLKLEGRFVDQIDISTFINSIQRRMMILTSLYGDATYEPEKLVLPKAQIINQKWKEQNYFSVRQKEKLLLGGVIGMIYIQEKPNKRIADLIQAAELFHIGKNASFGLGKVHFEKEVDYAN